MMKLTVAVLALIGALTVANATFTACPVNGPQLCKDCQAAVSSVAPDGYGNTVESLKTLCTKCNSDLCKQCLAYASGAFGGPNELVSYFPKCTQPYVQAGAAALYGPYGLFTKNTALVAMGSTTKDLCPFIQTQDTLKCFDLGYGSVSGDSYGFFEYLCVAAQSDLQRRCLYQYTSYSNYQGLPTVKYAILRRTLPLCLLIQSEADYACLKGQVANLDSGVTPVNALTTWSITDTCKFAQNVPGASSTCTENTA